MKITKKIIPFILAFATVFSFTVVPAHAEEYVSRADFYSWIASRGKGGSYVSEIFGVGCPKNEDGRHHAKSYVYDAVAGHYLCTCDACGDTFVATKSELSDAYQEQVQEMPYQGITSDGGFYWSPRNVDKMSIYYPGNGWHKEYFSDGTGDNDSYIPVGRLKPWFDLDNLKAGIQDSPSNSNYCICVYLSDYYPVNGTYKCIKSVKSTCSFGEPQYFYESGGTHFSAYQKYSNSFRSQQLSNKELAIATWQLFRPVYLVIPDVYDIPESMATDTRPVSISAPLIYTDNSGQTKTTETTIINETDKSVYNPVTGDTTTYTDWKYDYSSRTYTFSDESGNTSTVRYGDDNIEVVEGGNTYIYNYYMSDGGNTPAPDGHKHNYTEEITREATCTTAGIKTFTCEECGDTYTKAIPSLGHDWIVKEKVNSEYDENGEETVKGYTIYECSRCGEQKKSTDGSPPDSGGGAGKPSIWSKLGELFGTISGGLIDAITAALGKILDGLIALAKVIGEKLTAIVEMVLGWFDSLPAMFEGFLAFLSTVFGYLPQEIVILMTFGFAMAIFIGIIKIIRR